MTAQLSQATEDQLEISSSLPAKDGIIEVKDENNAVRQQLIYKQGVLEGIAKFYDTNAKLTQEVSFRAGKIDGLIKQYDQDGNVTRICI